ncbi:MAG: hypothetical protein JW795_09850, partial [Chitinivibrionales bacterium]|nr:hypothetical protein [Chitinivibrionales bacterium]
LKDNSNVSVDVYTIQGRKLQTITLNSKSAFTQKLLFAEIAERFAQEPYILKMVNRTTGQSITQRLMLVP